MRKILLILCAALLFAQPSLASPPRYAEGEAIVMYKTVARQGEARALSAADSAQDAGDELGVELLHSYRPIKSEDFAKEEGTNAAARTLAANVAKTDESAEYSVTHVKSASGESTEQLIARLRENPNVVSAMPNYVTAFDSAQSSEYRPNDEYYDRMWGLERINMPRLWARTLGAASEEAVVAVIDPGIIYDHEDLKDNIYTFSDEDIFKEIERTFDGANEEFSGGIFTTDDFLGSHGVWFHSKVEGTYGSEYEADKTGDVKPLEPVPIGPGKTWDIPFDDIMTVTKNSRFVGDIYGHGTHVAGTIGAVTDNGTGVAGIAGNVKILSVSIGSPMKVKGTNENGQADYSYNTCTFASDQIRAVDFILAAKDAGVNIRVANLSLGFWAPVSEDLYNPYRLKMKALSDAGIIVCIAAGNNGQNLDAPGFSAEEDVDHTGELHMPAMLGLENSIIVGASDPNDGCADFSNYSPSGRYTDIFAPGVSIVSTVRKTAIQSGDGKDYHCMYDEDGLGYTDANGTSMASPHVAGVAALLCSLYPEKSAAEIKSMILGGADGSVLKEGYSAHGRLDAYAAWKLGQSGGGGCSAGFGAAALLVLPVLWILSRTRAKDKRGR